MSKKYVFGFLDIARTQPHSFTRHLVGMLRMGLPHLSKQLRDQNNKQKQQKNKNQYFTKNPYFLLFFTIFLIFIFFDMFVGLHMNHIIRVLTERPRPEQTGPETHGE